MSPCSQFLLNMQTYIHTAYSIRYNTKHYIILQHTTNFYVRPSTLKGFTKFLNLKFKRGYKYFKPAGKSGYECIDVLTSPTHTGLEALPSKKKWSIDGTGVPGFLRPVWLWDGVAKPEKMGKKIKFGPKIGQKHLKKGLKRPDLVWYGLVLIQL